MKRIILLLALGWWMARPVLAAEDPVALAEIRQAQKARIEAVVHANQSELERVLADDLTYIHSTGALDTKKSYMESLTSGRVVYRAIEPSEVQYRRHGDLWILNGKMRLRVKAGDRALDLPVRFTEVYLQSNGVWQLEAYQSTRLPEENQK